ncbi:hypothetical protein YC2023_054929 [Brassica napus]
MTLPILHSTTLSAPSPTFSIPLSSVQSPVPIFTQTKPISSAVQSLTATNTRYSTNSLKIVENKSFRQTEHENKNLLEIND